MQNLAVAQEFQMAFRRGQIFGPMLPVVINHIWPNSINFLSEAAETEPFRLQTKLFKVDGERGREMERKIKVKNHRWSLQSGGVLFRS